MGRLCTFVLYNFQPGLQNWYRIVLPLGNLGKFVEQENAFALGFADGFHNPYVSFLVKGLVLFELVGKNYIF